MSKRLQIMLPDDEYEAVTEAARRQGKPVARLVRESLRRTLDEDAEPEDPQHRIAAILRFARFSGPTGDIEEILEDIERGRALVTDEE
jgi:hypothetical protein